MTDIESTNAAETTEAPKKRRGRKPGSKNKPKSAATPPVAKKRRPKRAKKVGKPARQPRAPKADESRFRVGIFNDSGLAILARRGSLELDADEAAELAGFCIEHFAQEG